MADKKISDLTAVTSISAGDLFEIENAGGNSRKVTAANAKPYIVGWTLTGTGQTATGVYDFSVDGAKANVEFAGLAGAQDILIICKGVTLANSGATTLRVSTDNGSTFYSASGDYLALTTNGVESNASDMGIFHNTSATAARTGIIRLPAAGLSGIPKISDCITSGLGNNRVFVASTSPITAVRIYNFNAGNLTGGKIYCLAR